MFDFKTPLRHWSLWLSGAGAAALGLGLLLPETALQLWNFWVPAELKALLPPEAGLDISFGLLVASIFAKFVRQAALADVVRAWLLRGCGHD